MADTWTPNYNIGKPENGSSRNTWGTTINNSFDKIDTVLKDHEDKIAARLKLDGSVPMTGSITFATNDQGIILSGNSRLFDDTNANTGAKGLYLDLAGNNLTVRSENGNDLLFLVNATEARYRGYHMLTTADANTLYVPTQGGGSVIGNMNVTGEVRATSFRLDDHAVIYCGGPNFVIQSTDTALYAVDRASDTHSFISRGKVAMGLDAAGNLTTSGDITAFSDIRLKDNVEPIRGALALLSRIRGVSYTFKADGRKATGVIAQEVESVLPHAVTQDADGIKKVAYQHLIAPMLSAIQELEARLKALEAVAHG